MWRYKSFDTSEKRRSTLTDGQDDGGRSHLCSVEFVLSFLGPVVHQLWLLTLSPWQCSTRWLGALRRSRTQWEAQLTELSSVYKKHRLISGSQFALICCFV